MKTLSSSALGLFAAFACIHLAAACSSSTETSSDPAKQADGSTVPEGATSTMCVKAEDCPNIPCDCASGIVNARHCVDGYCLDTQTTCDDTCGTKSDGGSGSDGGKSDSSTPKDGSTPAAAAGDACVPVSVSAIQSRVGAIAALIAGHQAVPATPANGNVNVSRNTAGQVTYINYDAAGTADDYTDSLSYDSAGHVTYWNHNGSGTTDVTESFSYNSAGYVTYFNRNADGTANDVTESFSYDSSNHLTYWNRNADGTAGDVTESFSYDSAGLVTYFNRNADGTADDVTESFSYDSMGRVTYWNYNADGSANDATLSISYSSSGQNISANGTRAAGATVKSCK
jgi:hypothetical protein